MFFFSKIAFLHFDKFYIFKNFPFFFTKRLPCVVAKNCEALLRLFYYNLCDKVVEKHISDPEADVFKACFSADLLKANS